jgi:hypothetical protein
MLKTDKLLVLNIELPIPCAARELSSIGKVIPTKAEDHPHCYQSAMF